MKEIYSANLSGMEQSRVLRRRYKPKGTKECLNITETTDTACRFCVECDETLCKVGQVTWEKR